MHRLLRVQTADVTRYRKLSLAGSSLGSLAVLTASGLSFALLTQPKAPGQFVPSSSAWVPVPLLQVQTWVDDAIVLFTTLESGFLQVLCVLWPSLVRSICLDV